jgi:hypothetical protein
MSGLSPASSHAATLPRGCSGESGSGQGPDGASGAHTRAAGRRSHGGPASGGAGKNEPGGRQISGYAEGRPALRRLHALPTAERVQGRRRRNQPERLVPAVRQEDLELVDSAELRAKERAAVDQDRDHGDLALRGRRDLDAHVIVPVSQAGASAPVKRIEPLRSPQAARRS